MQASDELPSILGRASKVGRPAFVFSRKGRTHLEVEVSGVQQGGERSLLQDQLRDIWRHRRKQSGPFSFHRKNPHQDEFQHKGVLWWKPDPLKSNLDGKVGVFDFQNLLLTLKVWELLEGPDI